MARYAASRFRFCTEGEGFGPDVGINEDETRPRVHQVAEEWKARDLRAGSVPEKRGSRLVAGELQLALS
jgi:hypothetical protein